MTSSTYTSKGIPGHVTSPGPSRSRANVRKSMLGPFWAVAMLLTAIYLFELQYSDFVDVMWAFAITAAALLSGYLWCSGRAHGVPVMPIFGASNIWAFAFPLVSRHPVVMLYNQDQRATASLTVIFFLLLATAVWYPLVKKERNRCSVWLSLSTGRGDRLFLGVLAAATLFTISIYNHWFAFSGALMSSVRGIVLGLAGLGIFVLAYRWGSRQLPGKHIRWFLFFLTAYGVTNATSTLLVGSMTSFLLAVIGFSIGRRKVPWRVLVAGVAVFMFLHIGKGEVRMHYLYGYGNGRGHLPGPLEYPQFFTEWISSSWDKLTEDSGGDAGQSLLQRASLLQILLLVERNSPDRIPFMEGATYANIPVQIVPRVFLPDKVSSHEGTVLLNLRYGLQTSRESAQITSIGWGQLSEAYANFGYAGVAGLAVFLGLLYGQLARWAMNAPPLSFRFLCALSVVALCFNTEISTAAYLAAIYQTFLALLGVTAVFMKPMRVEN